MRDHVEAIYRSDSRRVLATLIRLLGDFDLAEEALHDAFAARWSWPEKGFRRIRARGSSLPGGSRRSIACAEANGSTLPTRRVLDRHARRPNAPEDEEGRGRPASPDLHVLPPGLDSRRADRAHPARSLRTHHRGNRARFPHAGADARAADRARQGEDPRRAIPYEVPSRADLPARLDSVLHVIYLVFNEGYSASTGASLTRADLSGEAIRLGRLLVSYCPSRKRSDCSL